MYSKPHQNQVSHNAYCIDSEISWLEEVEHSSDVYTNDYSMSVQYTNIANIKWTINTIVNHTCQWELSENDDK